MSPTDPAAPRQLNSLPHPGPAVGAHKAPFVGNASIEDNLVEFAQIAIWNAIGRSGAGISLGSVGEAIRVAGHVDTRHDRKAVLAAVAAAIAPVHVIDDLDVKELREQTRAAASAEGAPIVRIRRFISADGCLVVGRHAKCTAELLDATFAA